MVVLGSYYCSLPAVLEYCRNNCTKDKAYLLFGKGKVEPVSVKQMENRIKQITMLFEFTV